MRIAIDATLLRKENTGTGFYIINLINGLLKIDGKTENKTSDIINNNKGDDKDSHNEYYVILNERDSENFFDFSKTKNFFIVDKKFNSRIERVLWQFFLLPFELKNYKIDVLHSPNYITPLIKHGLKIIVTIHDLTFLIFPEKFTITKRLFFRFFVPRFIKKADKIIAVSNNTKKDILNFFKVNEDKIEVTYESIPEYYYKREENIEDKRSDNISETRDRDEDRNILKKYGIEKKFILFVGMIEPRKNVLNILKAYKKIEKDLDADLVIVGKKGWYFKEIEEYFERAKEEGLKNKIIFTGYVSEPKLKYFYKNAFIFVYPSIYEGFGLPPLQAMASGIPVITSNSSSIPEVVGDAAIKINPENVDELADAIMQLYSDFNKREGLVKNGLLQASKFSIENFAENTLKVYLSV